MIVVRHESSQGSERIGEVLVTDYLPLALIGGGLLVIAAIGVSVFLSPKSEEGP